MKKFGKMAFGRNKTHWGSEIPGFPGAGLGNPARRAGRNTLCPADKTGISKGRKELPPTDKTGISIGCKALRPYRQIGDFERPQGIAPLQTKWESRLGARDCAPTDKTGISIGRKGLRPYRLIACEL
jgi:hypothetical protein